MPPLEDDTGFGHFFFSWFHLLLYFVATQEPKIEGQDARDSDSQPHCAWDGINTEAIQSHPKPIPFIAV